MQPDDLELVLAWRSNPEVYEHFRKQDGPLEWNEHLSWYGSRDTDRHDYVIRYQGRRVGTISLDPDSNVGVCIGEVSLWGEGIGSEAVEWLCEQHDREAFFAEIDVENETSRRLFESCGFSVHERDGEWLLYRRES